MTPYTILKNKNVFNRKLKPNINEQLLIMDSIVYLQETFYRVSLPCSMNCSSKRHRRYLVGQYIKELTETVFRLF